MIHVFLSDEIVKVKDISFISTIKKESFTYPVTKYYYELLLNNNTKIIQRFEYSILKYNKDPYKEEEIISYHYNNLYYKEKIKLNLNKNNTYSIPNDETLDSFKEFKENYIDLINKFEKVNVD